MLKEIEELMQAEYIEGIITEDDLLKKKVYQIYQDDHQ